MHCQPQQHEEALDKAVGHTFDLPAFTGQSRGKQRVVLASRKDAPHEHQRNNAAAVLLTSITLLPASDGVNAAAVESDVLPMARFPVKNKCRVG